MMPGLAKLGPRKFGLARPGPPKFGTMIPRPTIPVPATVLAATVLAATGQADGSRARSQDWVPGCRYLSLGAAASGATTSAPSSGSDHFSSW